MHLLAHLYMCLVTRWFGDSLLFRQDQAVGADAVSESLKDIVKHLVSSASPSAVLSTKPTDVRGVQVNQFTGLWVLHDPLKDRGPPAWRICVHFPRSPPIPAPCLCPPPPAPAVERDCTVACWWVMTTVWGKALSSGHRVPKPHGRKGRGVWPAQQSPSRSSPDPLLLGTRT